MADTTAEQKARDLLERMGVDDAQAFSAGDLVELANVLADNESLRAEVAALRAQLAEANDTLSFVERWANHHGAKPTCSAEAALSCIQHYPPIVAITRSYTDGKVPDTPNPWAEVAALRKDAERIDWLETMVRDHGALHIHDGEHPNGFGLGLKDRTLRQAIDAALAKQRRIHEALRRL